MYQTHFPFCMSAKFEQGRSVYALGSGCFCLLWNFNSPSTNHTKLYFSLHLFFGYVEILKIYFNFKYMCKRVMCGKDLFLMVIFESWNLTCIYKKLLSISHILVLVKLGMGQQCLRCKLIWRDGTIYFKAVTQVKN